MATIIKSVIKHVCDRCGTSHEIEVVDKQPKQPEYWQAITLERTGAKLDLCPSCNMKLFHWLEDEGATNMFLATHRDEGELL